MCLKCTDDLSDISVCKVFPYITRWELYKKSLFWFAGVVKEMQPKKQCNGNLTGKYSIYRKWNKTNGFLIRWLIRFDEKLTLAFCWPLTYDNIIYQHYRLGKRTTLQVVGQFISFVCRKKSLILKGVPVYTFLWAVIGKNVEFRNM